MPTYLELCLSTDLPIIAAKSAVLKNCTVKLFGGPLRPRTLKLAFGEAPISKDEINRAVLIPVTILIL